MGIFSNLWLYVTSKVITAPVLTGIEFSPATIFIWKASSSDAACCLKPLSIGHKTLLLQIRVKSLLLPRLVRGTYSKVWPGCRCSALPLWQDDRKAKNASVTKECTALQAEVLRGILTAPRPAFLESDFWGLWVCWSPSEFCFSDLGLFPHLFLPRGSFRSWESFKVSRPD